MAEFRPGAVVVFPFPYSDLSRAKLRPALVLAIVQDGDLVVCQVTSKTYASRQTIKLGANQFDRGSLPNISYIRPDKLTTIHKDICLGVVAYVRGGVLNETIEAACNVLKRGLI